jgi:hypothetical protein
MVVQLTKVLVENCRKEHHAPGLASYRTESHRELRTVCSQLVWKVNLTHSLIQSVITSHILSCGLGKVQVQEQLTIKQVQNNIVLKVSSRLLHTGMQHYTYVADTIGSTQKLPQRTRIVSLKSGLSPTTSVSFDRFSLDRVGCLKSCEN